MSVLNAKLDLALIDAKNADETKFIIDAGADVNARNIHGDTALMRAKTAEQTKLLIKAGANIKDTDIYGRTALMFAKSDEQTRLLVKAGSGANAGTFFKYAKNFDIPKDSISTDDYALKIKKAIISDDKYLLPDGATSVGLWLARYLNPLFRSAVRKKFRRT